MPKKTGLIDEWDRKLLSQLDTNSRQTDSEIAKKIGTSKQVVNYRIQKLIKNKVISNFYTIVNIGALGLNSHYVFLQLEKINKEQEKELLSRISSLDYVGWAVSGTGRWDVILLVYADSISTFDKSLYQIINLCGNHLHEYNFTTLIFAEHIRYTFLTETQEGRVKQTEKNKKITLNHTDTEILRVLSQNARASAVEISEKSNLPVHVVRYCLKSLIKQNTIEGFKPKLNVTKLGYQCQLLLIQFQMTNEKRKNEFINFCRQHKKIYYVTNTIGTYNLMLDIHVKNIEEFKEILFELKEKFSDVIKIYESFVVFEEHKIDYFPRELLQSKIAVLEN